MSEYKQAIRKNHKFYSQDLINLLFANPYSKTELLQNELKISRNTAGTYLRKLNKDGLLQKHKVGKNTYYINAALFQILTSEPVS